jgi:hypothetical protein
MNLVSLSFFDHLLNDFTGEAVGQFVGGLGSQVLVACLNKGGQLLQLGQKLAAVCLLSKLLELLICFIRDYDRLGLASAFDDNFVLVFDGPVDP